MLCASMKRMLCNRRLSVYWLVGFAIASLSPLLPLHANEAFPYNARIASEGTIYAGPSQDYYETDRLPTGSEVEVYRQTDDGWCAIRPPASSFSWLAAEHLEITDNPSLARVINLPVKTRVGSNFDDVHDVEYISLREGEIVELRGSAMLSDSADERGKRWFKISPPAGEFRWIHGSQLESGLRTNTASNDVVQASTGETIQTFQLKDGDSATPARQLAEVSSDAKLDLNSPPASSIESNGQDTGFVDRGAGSIALVHHEEGVDHAVSHPMDDSPEGSTEAKKTLGEVRVPVQLKEIQQPLKPLTSAFVAEQPIEPAAGIDHSPTSPESKNLTHVNVMTWEAVSSPTDPLAAPEPRSFVEKYNAVNVMLSRAILGDIEEWKLGKLATQSQLLLDQAQSATDIQLARGLADKVVEFQSLQQRNDEFNADPSGQRQTDSKVTQVAGSESASKPLPLPEINSTPLPESSSKQESQQDEVEMPKRIAQSSPRPMRSARDLRQTNEIDNSMFDASGTLVVVRAKKAGMPGYAITDKTGQIIKFVSTKDGTSLSHLVNKYVGVLGRQGFIRRLQKPHVVAERVVVLQR